MGKATNKKRTAKESTTGIINDLNSTGDLLHVQVFDKVGYDETIRRYPVPVSIIRDVGSS